MGSIPGWGTKIPYALKTKVNNKQIFFKIWRKKKKRSHMNEFRLVQDQHSGCRSLELRGKILLIGKKCKEAFLHGQSKRTVCTFSEECIKRCVHTWFNWSGKMKNYASFRELKRGLDVSFLALLMWVRNWTSLMGEASRTDWEEKLYFFYSFLRNAVPFSPHEVACPQQ